MEPRGLQPRNARGRVCVAVQRQHLALKEFHTPQRLAARRKVRVANRTLPLRRLEQRLAANHILANVVDDLLRPRRDAAVAFVAVVARGACEPVGARDLRQEVLLHLLVEEVSESSRQSSCGVHYFNDSAARFCRMWCSTRWTTSCPGRMLELAKWQPSSALFVIPITNEV
ncbi:hypothetical protein FI667_g17481, partial [Globisporangium splendens]